MKKTKRSGRSVTPPGRYAVKGIDRTLNYELPMMFWLATDGEVQIQKDLSAFPDSQRHAWLPVMLVNAKTEKRETLEELMEVRVAVCRLSQRNADAWFYSPEIERSDPEVQKNSLAHTSHSGLRLAMFQVEARRALLRNRIIDEVARKKDSDETREQVHALFKAIFEGMRARAERAEDQLTIDALAGDLDKMADEVLAHKPCGECGKPFVPPTNEDTRCSFHKKQPEEPKLD